MRLKWINLLNIAKIKFNVNGIKFSFLMKLRFRKVSFSLVNSKSLSKINLVEFVQNWRDLWIV